MDAVDDLDPSAYAGFLGGGGRSWRMDQPEELKASARQGDGTTARFVLYSGREVRFNPSWQEGGDVIATKEFKLAPFRANPVVLADHDPNHVIGRGTASIVESEGGSQLHGEVTWDIHESNPLAVLIAGQHQRGLRSAVSIGFMPGKGSGPRTKLEDGHPLRLDPEKVQAWRAGWYMRHPELYEWSSVSIPKDRGALQLQGQLRAYAAETEDDEQRIERIVRQVLDRFGSDLVLSAYRASAELRTRITAAVLSELPAPETQSVPAPAPDWWEDWK